MDSTGIAVHQMAQLMASLYYHMARNIVDELGEKKGKEVILKAMHEFGKSRGKAIRKNVEDQNLEPTLENFRKYYDMPMSGVWKTEREQLHDGYISKVEYCPMAKFWLDNKFEDIGKLYCAVDFAITEGYNQKYCFTREKCLLNHEDCCHHIVQPAKDKLNKG